MERKTGPRALVALAWPLTASNLLGSLSELVIVFWVARICGTVGLTAVTSARPLVFALLFLFGAIKMGASVSVGRSIGSGTNEGLRIYVQAAAFVIALWLVVLAISLPLSTPITDALGGGALARYLLPWIGCALPTVILAELSVEVASAAGQTRMALVRTILDLALLAVLTPISVELFGLPGAPVAMMTTSLVIALLLFRTIRSHAIEWKLGTLHEVGRGLGRRWLGILDIGLPISLTRAVMFAAQAVMIGVLADEGRTSVAAYGTAVLVVSSGAVIGLSVAQGGGIMIGQASGAGDAAAVRHILRTALGLGLLCGISVGTLYFVAARPLLGVFSSDPAVVEHGAHALSIMCLAAIMIAIWQVLLVAMAAQKASKRAGIVGACGELFGLAVVFLWDHEPRLERVAIAFVVSNTCRAALLGALYPFVARSVRRRPTSATSARSP